MKKKTESEQLRERRHELKLSLSEVARRAGTSAATLSRYENGWARFELQTLRKLATVLDCVLEVQLMPRPEPQRRKVKRSHLVKSLARLFWDRPLDAVHFEQNISWVLERVLDYGNLDDVAAMIEFMGRQSFLECVSTLNRLSPKTAAFWQQILEMEGLSCTKKYSRNTAWIF